ncbi:hypothetical protein [Streptomyces sp. NPDC001933]|uniref:hypothetical protein n=1 Tax=Streptomyces sp. NPDC001933 TaxID=3364626 RepID=UPI0036CB2FDC
MICEHLGLPTDEPSINVTRSRLGRLVRQGLLEQPGRGRYLDRLCQEHCWSQSAMRLAARVPAP